MMSMSRPGRRALALVASISLSRLYVRSGMGPTSPRNNSIPLGTYRDGLADYRSSFTVMKARRIAATTMALLAEGQDPASLRRVVFHVHRMKPIGRVFCRPHCLVFKEDFRAVVLSLRRQRSHVRIVSGAPIRSVSY